VATTRKSAKTRKTKAKATTTRSKSSKSAAATKAKTKPAKIDRRSGKDRRSGEDRRKKQVPVAMERRKLQRRAKVNRRRQIDPTTCERDYTADEIEFMNALEQYKRTSGRMFPTCSEVLEVLRGLGYVKMPQAQNEQLPGQPDGSQPTQLEQALNEAGRAAEPEAEVAPK